MSQSQLRFHLILIGTLALSGCVDENGNVSVGVSLGGTGTGSGIPIGTPNPTPNPRPDVEPDRMEDDAEYAVAYPDPVVQNCYGVERTIQFIEHYNQTPVFAGDRQDLFGVNSKTLPPIKFKLRVTVKNTLPTRVYEYIDSCKAAFQLSGSKTVKTTQSDYCLNDETVNVYQPNEERTYYYAFNLPNILQTWTASYHAEYSTAFYSDSVQRNQCETLSTQLVVDPYPSSMDGAPPDKDSGTSSVDTGSQNSSTNDSSQSGSDDSPIFGGFGLGDEL